MAFGISAGGILQALAMLGKKIPGYALGGRAASRVGSVLGKNRVFRKSPIEPFIQRHKGGKFQPYERGQWKGKVGDAGEEGKIVGKGWVGKEGMKQGAMEEGDWRIIEAILKRPRNLAKAALAGTAFGAYNLWPEDEMPIPEWAEDLADAEEPELADNMDIADVEELSDVPSWLRPVLASLGAWGGYKRGGLTGGLMGGVGGYGMGELLERNPGMYEWIRKNPQVAAILGLAGADALGLDKGFGGGSSDIPEYQPYTPLTYDNLGGYAPSTEVPQMAMGGVVGKALKRYFDRGDNEQTTWPAPSISDEFIGPLESPNAKQKLIDMLPDSGGRGLGKMPSFPRQRDPGFGSWFDRLPRSPSRLDPGFAIPMPRSPSRLDPGFAIPAPYPQPPPLAQGGIVQALTEMLRAREESASDNWGGTRDWGKIKEGLKRKVFPDRLPLPRRDRGWKTLPGRGWDTPPDSSGRWPGLETLPGEGWPWKRSPYALPDSLSREESPGWRTLPGRGWDTQPDSSNQRPTPFATPLAQGGIAGGEGGLGGLRTGLRDAIVNSIDDPNRQGVNSFVPSMLKAYDEIPKLQAGGITKGQYQQGGVGQAPGASGPPQGGGMGGMNFGQSSNMPPPVAPGSPQGGMPPPVAPGSPQGGMPPPVAPGFPQGGITKGGDETRRNALAPPPPAQPVTQTMGTVPLANTYATKPDWEKTQQHQDPNLYNYGDAYQNVDSSGMHKRTTTAGNVAPGVTPRVTGPTVPTGPDYGVSGVGSGYDPMTAAIGQNVLEQRAAMGGLGSNMTDISLARGMAPHMAGMQNQWYNQQMGMQGFNQRERENMARFGMQRAALENQGGVSPYAQRYWSAGG